MKTIAIMSFLSRAELAMLELFGDVPPPWRTPEEKQAVAAIKRRHGKHRVAARYQRVREVAERHRRVKQP